MADNSEPVAPGTYFVLDPQARARQSAIDCLRKARELLDDAAYATTLLSGPDALLEAEILEEGNDLGRIIDKLRTR